MSSCNSNWVNAAILLPCTPTSSSSANNGRAASLAGPIQTLRRSKYHVMTTSFWQLNLVLLNNNHQSIPKPMSLSTQPPSASTVLNLRAINASQPISRLPSDVLVNVFQLHRDAHHLDLQCNPWSGPRSPSTVIPYDQLLPFLATCHEWRVLALHSPLLWKRIDFGMFKPRICQMMIEAAKNCQLDIVIRAHRDLHFEDWTPALDRIILMVNLAMPRIRSVFARLPLGTFDTFLSELYRVHATPAGSLQELYLESYSHSQAFDLPKFNWSKLTSLKVLVMNNISVDWKSDRFRSSSLTHFSFVSGKDIAEKDHSDLITYLALLPSLVSFKYHPGDPKDTTALTLQRPVVMEHLREIDVTFANLFSFLAFFHRLTLPQKDITWKVCLEYDARRRNDTLQRLSDLIDLLASTTCTSTIGVRNRRDIRIYGDGVGHSFLICFNEPVSYTLSRRRHPDCVPAEHPQSTLIRLKLMNAIARYPNVQHFSHKDLRGDPSKTMEKTRRSIVREEQLSSWRTFLEEQPTLKTLSVYGTDIVRYISLVYGADMVGPNCPVPADSLLTSLNPSLRSLEVEGFLGPNNKSPPSQTLASLFAQRKIIAKPEAFSMKVTYGYSNRKRSCEPGWEKAFVKAFKKSVVRNRVQVLERGKLITRTPGVEGDEEDQMWQGYSISRFLCA